MTFEELKQEAKRHQWWSGMDGKFVVCERCGKESPIVPKSSTDNEVISAWNRMIEEGRH